MALVADDGEGDPTEMLFDQPTGPGQSTPLRMVLIDDQLLGYGPDLRGRLRYPSLTAVAAATPPGSAAVVELGSSSLLDMASISHDHPLREIRATPMASYWITLGGLLSLFQRSPHPLAPAFTAWAVRQDTFDSLFSVPEHLLDEGLDILERALGPSAQILAILEQAEPSARSERAGKVIDPPDLVKVRDLICWCLADEYFLMEAGQRGGSTPTPLESHTPPK